MKFSHFTVGTLFLASAACGRFGEVTLDVETLDANKQFTVLRNNVNFNAQIENIQYEFENGLLIGDKQESEIFDNVAVEFDFGDELVNEIDAGDLVIKADKLYDDFEFTLQTVTATVLVDFNNDTIFETQMEVTIDDINETFEFNDLGVNSFKQNIEMVLQFNPSKMFNLVDFQDEVVAQGVNVAAAVEASQTLTIDADTNLGNLVDEFDDITDNVLDPANAFVGFIYNIKAQQERVKP